jgi:hypothetical protein
LASRAPLALLRDLQMTRVLARSSRAPPSCSCTMWSVVRSVDGWLGCSGPSPGHTQPNRPTWARIRCADRAVHCGSLWAALLAPVDLRGCAAQRGPLLVRLPHTEQMPAISAHLCG